MKAFLQTLLLGLSLVSLGCARDSDNQALEPTEEQIAEEERRMQEQRDSDPEANKETKDD
jgi:hypothetical protein